MWNKVTRARCPVDAASHYNIWRFVHMICVGIDVAKDKHDCFILNSEGEVLADVFTISNSMDGFGQLLERIRDCSSAQDKIKVGLEATGHYSYNILGFLLGNGLLTYVLNPLHTNLYRKSLSLRKTKTDRVDARTITTIPGIGTRMGAMILAEAGDLSRFDSPDKLLAYAGLSPSTYQSGKLTSTYAHMEKRGSRYLRYALFNATKYVCHWDPTFAAYLAKKRAEGKHYNVAVSHAAKKLVRLIYALEKSREPYHKAA